MIQHHQGAAVVMEWDGDVLTAPDKPDWMSQAACTGKTSLMYPSHASAAPLLLCAGCPVRAECLEYAMENDELFGVWGGLSERERRRLRAKRRRLAAPTCGDRRKYQQGCRCPECRAAATAYVTARRRIVGRSDH